MRRPCLFYGIAALLAVTAFCHAYELPARDGNAPQPTAGGTAASGHPCRDNKPDCSAEAPGLKFRIIWGDWFTAKKAEPATPKCVTEAAAPATSCRTTVATPADCAFPVLAGGPTPTPCCKPGDACVIIKMADGRACCLPAGAKVFKDKNGTIHIDGAVSIPAPDGAPTIDGSLAKLEALKARRDAIEREEEKEREILKGLLKAQQERVNKVGLGKPTAVIITEQHPGYWRYVVPAPVPPATRGPVYTPVPAMPPDAAPVARPPAAPMPKGPVNEAPSPR